MQITDFSTKLTHKLLNRIYKDFLRRYLWITSVALVQFGGLPIFQRSDGLKAGRWLGS